jgi:hypothetical protein
MVNLMQRGTQSYRTQARSSEMPLEARIALLFCELSSWVPPAADGTKVLPFKIPQGLLALYFGTTREGINRKLKELERGGLVTIQNGGYLLGAQLDSLFLTHGCALPVPEYLADVLSNVPAETKLKTRGLTPALAAPHR